MELLDLLFIMKWLEHTLIQICSRILIYIMIIHISTGAPMMFTWVNWRLMTFLVPFLVYLKLEELHPTLGWRVIWLKKIIIGRNILWCYMMIYIFMSVFMRLLWATWSLHVFFAPYLVKTLVEVHYSLLGWKKTWLIIFMHIIYFWSRGNVENAKIYI